MFLQKVGTKLEVDPYFSRYGHADVRVAVFYHAQVPLTEIFALVQRIKKINTAEAGHTNPYLRPNFDNQGSMVYSKQHFWEYV